MVFVLSSLSEVGQSWLRRGCSSAIRVACQGASGSAICSRGQLVSNLVVFRPTHSSTMSFVAKSARLCLTARRFSSSGISYHRTYATSTRTYLARSAASNSRVTKAPASTTTNEVSRDDISEAITDAAGIREVLEDEVRPESVLSAESAASRISQTAFPGDFVSGGDSAANDWSKSYYGLSVEAFPREIADVLLAPIDEMDIEIKPGVSPSPCLPYIPDHFLRRWTYLPSRNQIPSYPEQGLWTRRMGTRSTDGDERGSQDSQQGVCTRLPRAVRRFNMQHPLVN